MNLPDASFDNLVQGEAPLINVGSGQDQTIREIAELIMKVLEFDGDLVFDTSRPDGTPRKLLDVSRINSLGWKAATSLEDGIGKTYRSARGQLELAVR
jgi:GDP-L-fucose synthase